MAQEDMNITISPEMLQEIIRVASETAIEKYQREAEKSRKAVRDKRLHNTKLAASELPLLCRTQQERCI